MPVPPALVLNQPLSRALRPRMTPRMALHKTATSISDRKGPNETLTSTKTARLRSKRRLLLARMAKGSTASTLVVEDPCARQLCRDAAGRMSNGRTIA